MLLLTIAALFIATGVVFALQNNISVAVTFLQWRFDGSLAMALLLALAAGTIIGPCCPHLRPCGDGGS